MRVTPNPNSKILTKAVVGGAGLALQPSVNVPDGMAVIILYVPLELVVGTTAVEIQCDLGLPWHVNGGGQFWFN